jgi:hypothetical protein
MEEISWKAQPKQELALISDADEILYGGARGGGKTDAGQAWLLYDIDKQRYRALVIRRNAEDLKDWTDRAQFMFRPTKAKITGNPAEIEWPSGAKARTGHLKDENAFTKYQGHEYQKMLIEELSHIPREKDYLKLIASCRSTVDGIKSQVFATTNPDDPGLEWIKDRWEIPDEPDFDKVYTCYKEVDIINADGKITKARRKLVFVPAKIEDNPILTTKDPNYIIFLESLKSADPNLYDAWRKGSWKGFGTEGSYYRTNMLKCEAEGRIKEGLYDPMLPVYTWCDLGISDSFVIGYFQVSMNQWRVIDCDEFEGESIGDAVNRMRQKGYTYAEHYAPHDIRVRDLGSGKSRYEIAENFGVKYNIATELGIADGINALRMRFGQLWFDKEKTKNLRKKLVKYHKEFDERHGTWKDKPYHDGNSNCADMLRYWAVTDVRGRDYQAEYQVSQIRDNKVKNSYE